ncbi:transketolase subunit A, partial [candidate division KSB1 bacterium]|nr:transketolase subunit A [candidate division KSB1 bacterium]
ILADIGYIPRQEWLSFYRGSRLSGCSERMPEYAIEAGCGALGHGLPQAVGIAFGAKLQNEHFHTYCIIGDGEMQEGSSWEAIQFAVKHGLSRLRIIIDANELQAMDFLENILTISGRKDDLKNKLTAFGCRVEICKGHDMDAILAVFDTWNAAPADDPHVKVLIAETVKGYGLACMERVAKFHFRLPTENELQMGKRYE